VPSLSSGGLEGMPVGHLERDVCHERSMLRPKRLKPQSCGRRRPPASVKLEP
jgi:hypothetical protein